MRRALRRLSVLAVLVTMVGTSCSGEIPTSMQLGDREEWIAGFDDQGYGACLYDRLVEQVSPGDMAIHLEYLDDPPTTTPESVVAARSQCVREVGLDYSDQFEQRFIPSCESVPGQPPGFCECLAAQLRLTVPYADYYDEQQKASTSPGYISPVLAEASAPCAEGLEYGFGSDGAFIAAADAVCAETAAYLDETADPDPAENVRISVRAFTQMIDELRNLSVADEVRPEVEAWLVLWDAYVQVGERYADALERGAPEDEIDAIGDEGDLPFAALQTIAEENDMPSCSF